MIKIMRIKVIFLPSSIAFPNADKNRIRKIILNHAKKAAAVLRFRESEFTFTVYPWERDGVHAFTQAKDWVRITINPRQLAFKSKRASMIERLIYIVYHEMHHAARGYAGFLPKKKQHVLMNSILSEGLADIFAREQYPAKYVFKVTKYNFEQVKKWIPKLKKIKWGKEAFEDPWLMGGEGKPKKLGYQIGRYLVENVTKRHPRLRAANLVHKDAREILKLGGVKV